MSEWAKWGSFKTWEKILVGVLKMECENKWGGGCLEAKKKKNESHTIELERSR